jgi:oligoendopeptidase F
MLSLMSRTRSVCLYLLILMLALGTMAHAKPDTLDRNEIDQKYKWNFSDIYKNWDDWEKDLNKVETMMDEYTALQGTLADGPQQILKANVMGDELGMTATKVFRYPGLQMAVDARDNDIAARMQQVRLMFAKFGTAMAWFNPEMLEIPWDTMSKWLDETPDLAPYRFGIEDLYRQQTHVLSEDKEQLLSYYSQVNSAPSSIFDALSTADVDFPEATLSDGEEVTISPGQYYNTLTTNRNQDDRRMAFEAFYGMYNDKKNTYAAIYNGVLQSVWAGAQARNYDSCIESVLDGNNIPVSVYENLVNMVRENPGPVHKYIALRKELLGLEEYHGYDGSVSLVDTDTEYPFDEIKDWIVDSVKPLGKDYQKKMKTAFAEGWIDVYENEGKRGGAFSAGVYGVHPYMLMNYNDTMGSLFTMAHELGHTLHTMLANETQPYSTSGYTLFVAEVASTLNERLLLDYMLEKTDDPKERAALLVQSIDDIISTFYSQVMFADFELQAYRLVEANQPVTADALTEIYTKLWKDQMGPSATFDELYGGTWTRISHFYSVPFYVYQYATCYASSAQIYDTLITGDKNERKAATERYLNLLKSGGNDHPMALLQDAGVDLTQPGAFQAVIDNLDGLVDQLAIELKKL